MKVTCRKCGTETTVRDKTVLKEAGKLKGKVQSDAKSEAARANGKLGGRPKKPETAK